MLKLQKTRIIRTFHRDILPGFEIKNEGQALVYVNDNGLGKVRPSSGAAGERFAGMSLAQTTVPDQLTRVEELVLTGETTVKLDRTNVVASQIRVEAADGSALQYADGTVVTAGPGKFTLNSVTGELGFDDADNGAAAGAGAAVAVKYTVFYKYIPTVQEAIAAQGSGPVGGVTGANYVGTVGLIVEGDVSTDQFDITADWTNATKVCLGPNGILTTSGGTELRGANIIEAPGVASPFLTVNFGPFSG